MEANALDYLPVHCQRDCLGVGSEKAMIAAIKSLLSLLDDGVRGLQWLADGLAKLSTFGFSRKDK